MSPMKLPPAKSSTSTQYDHTNDPWFKNRFSAQEDEKALAAKEYHVPPYLKRDGYKPRKPEDFGDGGAFPEIHIAQYPLGMGRDKTPSSKILPVTVDSKGNVAFDNIVKQNENASKIVYSQHRDLVPKILRGEESDSEEESDELQKEIEETTEATKAAIEKIVNVRLSAAQPKNVPKHSSDSKFIKYKPSQQAQAFNSGAKERIIRMVEMPVDPLEPPKFKHKRVPRASGSPPVPVMHSPPRPVTVKDQQDWKIPPCISNWKNPKGYTIPLDKRLAADGRGLQDVQINDNFAKLSESLYVAEQKAREAVAMRSKVQKEMAMKEKEKKEMELRALAAKARSERTGIAAPVAPPARNMDMDDDDMRSDYVGRGEREVTREAKEEREERLGREKIREERRRERERERRLEAKDAATGKKSKITRDRDRDISEKVALGMASVGSGRGEVMYDQRLFNQEKGMESGFAADDQYNVYDKGLFTAQATLSTLYQPKKDMDNEMYGGADEQLEKIRNTERFKPDKGFTGAAEKSGKRERPVEFEQVAEEADPFGLDQFLTEVKKGKKAMDKIGGGGTMKASAGSTREGYDGGSGRSRIDFDKGLARERGGSRYCHYGNCLPCGLPCGEEYPFGHACKLRCHGPRPPPNPEFTLKPKKKKHNFQSEPTAGTPCPPCPELVWRFCLGQHFAAERMMVCSNKGQFSCDNLCGNPLACGNDYCTKTCHALQNLSSSLDRRTRGVPCEDCTLPCQKERTPACSHPCPQPCHPEECPPVQTAKCS